MNVIGLTGKSGSGKSYFADKLGENLNNSVVIKIDDVFSEAMNNQVVISKIYEIYGDRAIKNGRVDLDTILRDREMFDTIYNLVIDKIEKYVKDMIEAYKSQGKLNIIIDWWGLPKSNIVEMCDYMTYIDVDEQTRLNALKKRETYITQEEIDIRDDVLSVDYNNCSYDMIVQNDHRPETMDKFINDIQGIMGLAKNVLEEPNDESR